MQIIRVYGRGCHPQAVARLVRKPRPKTKLEQAKDIVVKIRRVAARLHDLNTSMALPCFVYASRTAKDSMYDEVVKLTRLLQRYGKDIEALGYKLEPSDLT